MATLISRIGSRVSVEIPEEMLRQANLAVGDPVEWTLTPEGDLALSAPNIPQTLPPLDGEEDYDAWCRQEILAGLADVEAGRTVSHEKVVEWLESWGTEHELPPPL